MLCTEANTLDDKKKARTRIGRAKNDHQGPPWCLLSSLNLRPKQTLSPLTHLHNCTSSLKANQAVIHNLKDYHHSIDLGLHSCFSRYYNSIDLGLHSWLSHYHNSIDLASIPGLATHRIGVHLLVCPLYEAETLSTRGCAPP